MMGILATPSSKRALETNKLSFRVTRCVADVEGRRGAHVSSSMFLLATTIHSLSNYKHWKHRAFTIFTGVSAGVYHLRRDQDRKMESNPGEAYLRQTATSLVPRNIGTCIHKNPPFCAAPELASGHQHHYRPVSPSIFNMRASSAIRSTHDLDLMLVSGANLSSGPPTIHLRFIRELRLLPLWLSWRIFWQSCYF